MKKLSIVLAGLALIAAGCASTKSDAAAGAVAGEKKACCKGEGATCTDAEKAKAASPGMVGEKKSCTGGGCSASASSCTAGAKN